jgi:hypothetical protein
MPGSQKASEKDSSTPTDGKASKKLDSAVIAAWIGAGATIVAASMGVWISATSENPAPPSPSPTPPSSSHGTAGSPVRGRVETSLNSRGEWVSLNIRVSPDPQSRKVGQAEHGDELDVVCVLTHGDSHKSPAGDWTTYWYKVPVKSAFGYVSDHYIEVTATNVPQCDDA